MKRCRALALVFVLSSVGHLAFADDDAGTLAARQRFREGVEFFDKGQYESARAAFLQAYALRNHPDILLNLGHSSLKAGRALEAYKYFRQFTVDAKNPSVDKLQDANTSLAEALSSLGTIAIKAPKGSSVSLDTESLGQTPLRKPIVTDPGPHTVLVKLPDGTERSFNVKATAGLTTDIDATPPAATPAVAPPPATAEPSTVNPTLGSGPQAPEKPSKSTGLGTPQNMAPFWIGVGVTAAAAAGATTMYLFKTSAQDDADAVEKLIKERAAKDGTSTQGICSSTSTEIQRVYGDACSTLKDNRDKVDTNALLGNIFLGVGVASAVGTVVYYFAAARAPKAKKEATWLPVVMPDLRQGHKGLQVSVQF
jgi:tetratricopeptide (TPR) repeat protein